MFSYISQLGIVNLFHIDLSIIMDVDVKLE